MKTQDLKRIIDGIDRNDIYTKKRMVSLSFLAGLLSYIIQPRNS